MTKEIAYSNIEFLKLKTLNYTLKACIQSVTISVNNRKINLTKLQLQIINKSYLQLCYSKKKLTFASNSTKLKLNATILL